MAPSGEPEEREAGEGTGNSGTRKGIVLDDRLCR